MSAVGLVLVGLGLLMVWSGVTNKGIGAALQGGLK